MCVTVCGTPKASLVEMAGMNFQTRSNAVRAITFDESGYKGSEMYVVKPAEKANNGDRGMFLEHGKCLYTTLLADNDDTSIPEKMFRSCHEWALRPMWST